MRLAVIAMALLLTGCAETRIGPEPPKRYQGEGLFWVKTLKGQDVHTACYGASIDGEAPGPVLACANKLAAFLPNPCEWRSDPYAQILCHELAHLQGWGSGHPR
jgi:hypothetical protein